MNATVVKTMFAVAALAVVASAAAQLSVGGAPTGHRNQLQPVPPRPRPWPSGNTPQFGDPLVGLNASQQKDFTDGREEFESVETIADGLGPIFNNNSCAACHANPVSGGVSTITVTRFGRSSGGHFDPLTSQGGSLLQQFATVASALETVPAAANVVAHRLTPPLFGDGLLEAITDDDIRANAARPQRDGISGRVSVITDPTTNTQRVGRLGWKAQHATVLGFAGDAYLNEMGITNRFFPDENAPDGDQARLKAALTTTGLNDPPDPVTGLSDIDLSANFIRLLAPPPTQTLSASSLAGQQIFTRINCSGCHTPTMTSGSSPIASLSNKTVALYSDLLLHDMGSLGDGIGQSAAQPQEIKTPPLWGLRIRTRLLHDGRATSVDAAIRAHTGEAQTVRDRYTQLSATDVQNLLSFLNSI